MEASTKTRVPLFKRPWMQSLSGIVIIGVLLGAVLIYKDLSSHVSIDMSVIEAPVIAIGPESQGVVQAVYVKPGDVVKKGEVLAQVGAETLSAGIDGLVIATQNVPGQVFMPGGAVVSMIDPHALRVVGTLDENKGLSKIKVGDPVSFTVDAFGNQNFVGVVDEISPTSNDSGVAFTISDKRETRKFDVKVRFNPILENQFKNGMSAKMKVYPTR
jgi:multidrug resistance efflux pump